MCKKRCRWAENVNELYTRYHDEQWGVPVRDDGELFEMLILESFHCGLSWLLVLTKREHFRAAFDGFDPHKMALYGEEKISELMENNGIIRNRRKIDAAVKNAAAFLRTQQEFGSFSNYIWSFTGGQTVKNTDDVMRTKSELSDKVAKDMKKRGFAFMGSVTVYSYLQAVGVINDHETSCFRYNEV